MTFRLDRRTLLRGVAATGTLIALPLPRLDIMLDGNGLAYAAGDPLPLRFCLWFFGNGIRSERWNPAAEGQGSAWSLSEELAPLAAVKSHLSVVSGLAIKSPITDDPHVAGAAGALTGAASLLKDEVNASIGRHVNTVQLPSIDQLVARAISPARYKSVELGLSKSSDPDIEGTLYHNVSHSGPDAPNPPDYDPRSVFNRLFADVTTTADPKADLLSRARGSVLDAVLADAATLRTRLGASDQKRLDQHMDGVRALELQLESTSHPAVTCQAPAAPTLGPDLNRQATTERNAVFSELMALAFACDLTRVISYLFAPCAGHVYFPDAGLNQDFHNYYNHDATQQEGVHQGVSYEMKCFADFLSRLQTLPEGDGTLLDHALIYATSDVSSGLDHGHSEFPVLFAGKASGKLRGDSHVRRANDNYSKALVTVLDLMGIEHDGVGKDDGRAAEGITGF